MSNIWNIRDNCGSNRSKKVDISHSEKRNIIRFHRNMGIMLIQLWKLTVIKRYPREETLIFSTTSDWQTSKRICFDRMRNTNKFRMISISAFESKRVHNHQIIMYFHRRISQMCIMKIYKLIIQMGISKSSSILIKTLNIFLSWHCSLFRTPWGHSLRGMIRILKAKINNIFQEYWILGKEVNSNSKIIHRLRKTKNSNKMSFNRKR